MGNITFIRGAGTWAMVLLALLAASGGCAPKSMVKFQFDSKTDFSAFKTYTIEASKSPSLDLRILDSKPLAQVIQESIERQLEGKGLHKSASANVPADLIVHWAGAIKFDSTTAAGGTPGVDLDAGDPDSGVILDSGSGGGGVPVAITKGGIKIDLISAKTKQVVWRGGVGAILKDKIPDPERVDRLNKSMAELFANYPPKAGGG